MKLKVNYKVMTMKYAEIINNVQLPTFQRSVVWQPKAKKELLKTISEGMPFGALLLYEMPQSELNRLNIDKKYQLIDGLQRISTINSYKNNKFYFLDLDELYSNPMSIFFVKIEDFYNMSLSLSIKNKIIKKIEEMIKEFEGLSKISQVLKQESIDILNMNKINSDFFLECLEELINEIKETINNYINLDLLEIPVIIYTGDKDYLADMFEKINTSGTKLSKYEIYAATWGKLSEFNYEIHDDEILTKIDKRYSDMVNKSNIEIENYKEGSILKDKRINLFEYAYAIGKILRDDKIKKLFYGDKSINNDNASRIDSIGFSIIAACLRCSIQGISQLPKYFENATEKTIIQLKDCIVDVALDLQKKLEPYIISYDNHNYGKYLETQLVSMIASLFSMKYKVNDNMKSIEQKANYINNYNIILNNIPSYYIYDKIKGYWDNSGDTKITKMISDDITVNRYYKKISEKDWEFALNDWMEESNKKTSSSSVNYLNKLFLNYMMKLTNINLPDTELRKFKYDIEHIIPVEKLEQIGFPCAISSVCNLCFLIDKTNRAKHNKSLYEYMKENIYSELDEDIIKQFYYPVKEEILFLDENNISLEKYKQFLENRKNYLIEEWLKLIQKI